MHTGIVLGHDLTFSKQMAHQYVSGLSEVSLEQLQQYVRVFLCAHIV